MAEIKIHNEDDLLGLNPKTEAELKKNSSKVNPKQTDTPRPIPDSNTKDNAKSAKVEKAPFPSEDEREEVKLDVNDISVSIKDGQAPIIVLFGPRSSGKTMTLVRLSRYLKDNGYVICPEPNFRSSRDTHYKHMCEQFPEMVSSDNAAMSTSNIDFMLVRVLKEGRCRCQILEAPGELYFDEKSPMTEYPTFLNTITTCKNRKIWIFMLEPDWKDAIDRDRYVDRISRFVRTSTTGKDKHILLMNKIDTQEGMVIRPGVVNFSELLRDVKNSYPGILTPFLNRIPISNWFEKYTCKLIPFQTGLYSTTASGRKKYIKSNDIYPRKLWEVLKRYVR